MGKAFEWSETYLSRQAISSKYISRIKMITSVVIVICMEFQDKYVCELSLQQE